MNSSIINVYDYYRNKYQANIDSLEIDIHVYGIAFKDGEILISPQFDGFDFPGGTAEKGETHIETLKREIKEETGYLVEPIELINVYTSFFHHPKTQKNYQSYMIFYLVSIIDGEISDSGFSEEEKEYAKKAKWVSINELKDMKHICSLDIKDELLEMALEKIHLNKI